MEEPNKLEELRGKSVDAIVAKLGALSLTELEQLLELETADDKPRSTLLAPLQHEIDARLEAGDDKPDEDATEQADPEQAESVEADPEQAAMPSEGAGSQEWVICGVIAGIVGKLRPDYVVAPADGDVDPVDHAFALATVAHEAIDALLARPGGTDAADPDEAADAAVPASAAPDVADIDLDREPACLAFAAPGGQLIAELGALQMGPEAFTRRGGGFVLDRAIELPAVARQITVGAVWAFDADGAPVGRCKFASPLGIGGAVKGDLPARTLRFSAD